MVISSSPDAPGLEHHVRELADLRLPHLVLCSVDGEGPEEILHDHFSVHGVLREPAHRPAVHLELRVAAAGSWTLPEERSAFPGTGIESKTMCLYVSGTAGP